MIEFKPVTPRDKELLTSYFFPGERRDANLSIVNLCSWQFLTCSSFAVVDGLPVLRFCFDSARTVYTIPGGGVRAEEVVRQLARQAVEEGLPLYFYGIVPELRELLDKVFPEVFEYKENRDHFDYLYLRKDLAELKGKDYQTKRNHVNKFKKRYDFRFIPLTAEMVPDCLRLYDEWGGERRCGEDEGLKQERQALTYALERFRELDVTGGSLWVEGRMVAFTFGAPVNYDTFCVHAEKALGEFEGAYNAINQEFAQYLPEKFVYLNREEDLGLPGLRKAKMSYRPVRLLEKGLAVCPPELLSL